MEWLFIPIVAVLAWMVGYAMGVRSTRDLLAQANAVRVTADRELARSRALSDEAAAMLAQVQRIAAERGVGIGDA